MPFALPLAQIIAIPFVLALACGPLTARAGAQAAADLPTLGVRLSLEQTPELRLAVQVTLRGDTDGETQLAVAPDWGGVPADRFDLLDASAMNTGGKALEVEEDSNVQWVVRHGPGEAFTFTAWLYPAELRASGKSEDHYRPLLEPGLFQAIGHVFLPLPVIETDEDDPIRLSLSFDGFEAADWKLAHSFGTGFAPVEVVESRSRISGMLFCAGNIQVIERNIRGGRMALALDSTPWPFDGETLAELVSQILHLEREFMNDDSSPFYLVSAIGVGPPSTRGFSLGGTGLTNSFALYLQPNTEIDAGSPMGPQVLKLLSHECFHEWNGLRIRLVSPSEEHYWFSEGFTEYFARRVLFEKELVTTETYLEWLNESLRDYQQSPTRNLPAEELARLFWTDRDGQKQPYLRGEMVAMLAEHAIRERSAGEQSLTDFMRSLLAESKQNPNLRFGTEELLTRLAVYCGPQVTPTLRSICVDGATCELPEDVLGDPFVVKNTWTHVFEPGFHTAKSLESKRVIGLLEGSAAQAAGVREGDDILALSIEHGKTDVPVELTVRTGFTGEPRKVSYLPRGDQVLVQRVELAKD